MLKSLKGTFSARQKFSVCVSLSLSLSVSKSDVLKESEFLGLCDLLALSGSDCFFYFQLVRFSLITLSLQNLMHPFLFPSVTHSHPIPHS